MNSNIFPDSTTWGSKDGQKKDDIVHWLGPLQGKQTLWDFQPQATVDKSKMTYDGVGDGDGRGEDQSRGDFYAQPPRIQSQTAIVDSFYNKYEYEDDHEGDNEFEYDDTDVDADTKSSKQPGSSKNLESSRKSSKREESVLGKFVP